MQELIDTLMQRVNVNEQQARGGAGLLFRMARDKLGAGEFDRLLGGLPGMDSLLREAPAPGGRSTLFGGLAGALGGQRAALLAAAVGGFNRLGMDTAQAKQFGLVVVDFLRERLDPEAAAELERSLKV